MTKLADLSAAELDLRFTGGDDLLVTLQFVGDPGYSGWEAAAHQNGVELDFTVDTTGQGAGTVVLRMTSTVASAIDTGWRWFVRVNGPTRRTLMAGKLEVERS